MNNSTRIRRSEWFSNSMGTVGVILCWDIVTGCYKAYMGCVNGLDEGDDTENIVSCGSTLPEAVAQGFFPNISLALYGWD